MAALALLRGGVEVERSCAADALRTIHQIRGFRGAHTLTSCSVVGRTLETVVTLLFSRVPEPSIRTNIATLPIEVREASRAVFTPKSVDVEDLSLRAGDAFVLLWVKVEGMETSNAGGRVGRVGEVSFLFHAIAFVSRRVKSRPFPALLTCAVLFKIVFRALVASIAIAVGSS